MGICIFKHVKSDRLAGRVPGPQQYWARLRSPEHDEFAPPLQIVSFGAEDWQPGREYLRQRSDMFGVEYVREGSVEFLQDGRRYTVRPGEVYVLRYGVFHRYTAAPPVTMRKYYVSLRGTMLEPLLLATGMDSCDHVVPDTPSAVEDLLLQIRDLLHAKPAGYSLELSVLAYRLIVVLSRSVSRRHPEPVRAAIEHIDRNLNRDLSSNDLSAAAGLSLSHFNRLFRRHVGLSPKQFFLRHKMAWAEHLLRDTQYPVKEVAATLGYTDPLYFSAQFKKHAGSSPKLYRASKRSRPEGAEE